MLHETTATVKPYEITKPAKRTAAKRAELAEVITAIYTHYNVETAENWRPLSGVANVRGYVVLNDGLRWPVWKQSQSSCASVVWITTLTGKLEGYPGITTSCKQNALFLARRSNADMICHECFAADTLDRYDAADEHATLNSLLLQHNAIPADLLPRFRNVQEVRIEPFGDQANTQQSLNMITMCNANPRVRFGWWTKNPGIVDRAIKIAGRPVNVSFVLSSCFKNKELKLADVQRVFPWVDHVFTVFTKDYIKDHDIKINCGARNCWECGRCYKNDGTTDGQIREQLK